MQKHDTVINELIDLLVTAGIVQLAHPERTQIGGSERAGQDTGQSCTEHPQRTQDDAASKGEKGT